MSLEETIQQLGHLVDGAIVQGGPDVLEVVDPSTGEVAARVPAADEAMLDRALDAALRAQPAWAADLEVRRTAIRKMADAVEANMADLEALATVEKGVPWAGLEYHAVVANGRARAEFPIPVDVIQDDDVKKVTLERFPVGVVAAIAPWNAPGVSISSKIYTSLLLGNTVVAKPSPFTPLATLRLAELWRDIVPPGVLNIVAGADDVGAALVSDPRVRMVAFTGSAATGRVVAAQAGKGMKHVLAELGGNDAAIVLDDVDVKKTAPQLFNSAFILAGQACAAVKRLLVHESVYEDMVSELAGIARDTEVGPGTAFPPLVTRPQYERICELVADALEHGGEAVAGGAPLDGPGFYFPPTIVTGVGPGTRLVDEEQFGPALPIMPFSDIEQAVAIANGTEYGLCASVWSSDIPRARRIAARLEAGTVLVNNHVEVAPHVPFGGTKSSGVGRSNGHVGIDQYAEYKTVIVYKDSARV